MVGERMIIIVIVQVVLCSLFACPKGIFVGAEQLRHSRSLQSSDSDNPTLPPMIAPHSSDTPTMPPYNSPMPSETLYQESSSPSEKPSTASLSTISFSPTPEPTFIPSIAPSFTPTMISSVASLVPSFEPTTTPTDAPSRISTTITPTAPPTLSSTIQLTNNPTTQLTQSPTLQVTGNPTLPTTVVPTNPSLAPSLKPTEIGSAVPTADPTSIVLPPSMEPEAPDVYYTSFVKYVYTSIAVVIAIGSLWFCCRGYFDRCSNNQYSMISTNDLTEFIPRQSRSSAQLQRDIEIARFQRMAGGSNTYPNPFNRESQH